MARSNFHQLWDAARYPLNALRVYSIDIRHLANYYVYCMAIRSIPPARKPSSSPYRINVYGVRRQMPHYTRIRTSTLESLLAEAERLESEQVEVVKLLPYDEELHSLDKLQWVIMQLKIQIALRAKNR